jgi:GNAT superfamily N-acetyltransferase
MFRAALARAMGAALSRRPPRPILCDEFTTALHRRMAKAIAYNLRKLVWRHRLILIAATTWEDIIEDLQPDRLVRLGDSAPCCATPAPRSRPFSLLRRAVIEPGTVADYRAFASMHYRQHDGLGFVDRVFLLRERGGAAPLGILVFAHAPLELALRNAATAGRFIRQPRRLYRELRILRRLVMHPDVRGCGLGHWFVRSALPLAGARFVECLAAMGAVNPVFERAGMTRIGRCPLPRGRLELLRRLRAWKLDPFARDFPDAVAGRPKVRALVERTIRDWMNVAHGAHKGRTRRSDADRPVPPNHR